MTSCMTTHRAIRIAFQPLTNRGSDEDTVSCLSVILLISPFSSFLSLSLPFHHVFSMFVTIHSDQSGARSHREPRARVDGQCVFTRLAHKAMEGMRLRHSCSIICSVFEFFFHTLCLFSSLILSLTLPLIRSAVSSISNMTFLCYLIEIGLFIS